jgi:hypothetical protein
MVASGSYLFYYAEQMAGQVFLSAMLIVTALAAQTADQSPFAGEWIANISESRLSPNLPLQSVALRIAIEGDRVTMSSRFVDPSWKEHQAAETFRTDGTETPGTLNPGVGLVARWLGTHVLATIAKKGDELVGIVTYEVSSDGKTLTLRSSGSVEHVILFDKK